MRTHTTEEWRPVVGYEGLYEVSDLGQVRRLWRDVPPTIRKQHRSRGYWRIRLTLGEVRKTFRTHTLVACAFIGPPPTPKHEINHKDGDKSHQHPDNLEWVTHGDNVRHAWTHGLCTIPAGEKHPSARLTNDIVMAIRASSAPEAELVARYGVQRTTIYDVRQRRSWKHLP